MILTTHQREMRKHASEKLGWFNPNAAIKLFLSKEERERLATKGGLSSEASDASLIKVIKDWIAA